MTERKVNNMNVVTHACAVGGGVVVAVDVEVVKLADCNLSNIGHKVVGDAVGVFADSAALVCADGVEVTKKAGTPFAVCSAGILEHSFYVELCCAVGVCGFTFGHILFER